MTRPRRIVVWGLFVALWMLGTSQVAAKGFYFGGSLGRWGSRDVGLERIADGSTLTGGTDASDNGWKFFGGFKVMRFLAAEFDYRDHGQVVFSATSDGSGAVYAAGPIDGIADTKSVGIAALAVLPAGRFKFFIKGGVSRWRTETIVRHSTGGIAASDQDGSDPLYGVGAAWDFSGPGGLRLEYERIVITAGDQNLTSLGVHFRF